MLTLTSYQVKKQDGNLQDLLMNHKAIVDRFHNYTPSINYTNQHNLTYILSEVGNSLEGHEKLGFQAVLGAALWAVDLQMYAMTLGVQRVNMAQKPSGGFSLWLPEQQEDQKPGMAFLYPFHPSIQNVETLLYPYQGQSCFEPLWLWQQVEDKVVSCARRVHGSRCS